MAKKEVNDTDKKIRLPGLRGPAITRDLNSHWMAILVRE